jgi:hypothetical protein
MIQVQSALDTPAMFMRCALTALGVALYLIVSPSISSSWVRGCNEHQTSSARRFASEELEAFMSRPAPDLVAELASVDGDILVLGAGGKMGPTLASLARNAAPDRRIIAVARFTQPGLRKSLAAGGIEAIAADLLDRKAVQRLPQVRNVLFMAGRKFGASADQGLT